LNKKGYVVFSTINILHYPKEDGGDYMKYFKKIEGEKVFISPINHDDYEVFTKWKNDLEDVVMMGWDRVSYGVLMEKNNLENIAKNPENYQMCIVLKETEQLIGYISLFDVDNINRTAKLGMQVGEKEYRGKGYGEEALELILSFAFKMLNINNVMLFVYEFNDKAINLYKKVGFKEIGRRRQAFYVNRVYFDEIFMDILSDEYKCKYLNNLPKKEVMVKPIGM